MTREDCISREAVLETIECCNNDGLKGIFCSYNDGKRFEEYIKELPPVTPNEKTGWIPVSERLPKVVGVYRVTRYYPNNVMNPIYLVDACCFDGSNTWYNDNRINHERAYVDNVIAWQENPEPYKPQESEDTE